MVPPQRPLRQVTFAQLDAVLHVVETGSMSAAARQMNVGDQVVRDRVKEVERIYGVKLFDRREGRHGGSTPTTMCLDIALAGLAAMQHLARAETILEQARKDTHAANQAQARERARQQRLADLRERYAR